jgi:hypothetical protein
MEASKQMVSLSSLSPPRLRIEGVVLVDEYSSLESVVIANGGLPTGGGSHVLELEQMI